MLNLTTTASSVVAPSRVPASLVGARFERRPMAVGTAAFADGIHTPAFLKDVVSGVRAWSPPV